MNNKGVAFVMGQKMKDIINEMPLMAVVKNALMRDEKEPLAQFTLLLAAIWRNDWTKAQRHLKSIGIPLPTAAQLFMQAGVVTEHLLASLAPRQHRPARRRRA